METKANYVLIGTFTLVGFAGLLGFFLWFARLELDRQFAYYDISFTSVSGLGTASDVRFAGLPVGQVVSVGFSPEMDGSIRVRVEIDAATPVRTDSVATIEAQGVTGVSFVSISPGSPAAPLLEAASPEAIPEIEAGRSVVQSLSEDAPALLAETLTVVREVGGLLGGENRNRIERILGNVETASSEFSRALTDFSAVADSVSRFATQIDSFNETLEGLTGSAGDVLATADATLIEISAAARAARAVLSSGIEVLDEVQTTAAAAERYISQDLSGATGEVARAVAGASAQLDGVASQAAVMLDAFTETARLANARLAEAESLFASADAAIAQVTAALQAVEMAADDFDALTTGDGAALIAETRAAVADATEGIRIVTEAAQSLPVIMADVRAATDAAKAAIGSVGSDLGAAAGQLEGLGAKAEGALDSVTETFANANATLTAIDAALETGGSALAAAERAFAGADRVLNEDVAGITADLRGTLGELNSAISQVAADLPAITADLRGAASSAEAAFDGLEPVVSASGGAAADISRLARELRALIQNLDGLIGQIQRDPARFFLNQRPPDFRR